MDERDASDPLRDLAERLDKARRAQVRPVAASDKGSAGGVGEFIALGWRIGLELVVGVGVGFGIGWALDHFAGTRPWGMLAGFFIGVAAGMLNVYRTVKGLGMAMGYKRSAPPQDTGADWDDED